MERKSFRLTVFFALLACVLASVFLLQQFAVNQSFTSTPTFGSAVQTLTDTDIQNAVNNFVEQSIFFNRLPTGATPFLSLISRLNVASYYNGTVVSRSGGFDFAPTAIKEGNGYKMWWCGASPANSSYVFAIYYATSNDSLQWSPRQLVLSPTNNSADGFFACQPTVVKVNDTYYMYYVGASLNLTNVSISMQGSIFLARSSDGVQWSKYSLGNDPEPVIKPLSGVSSFVNQPSVLYYNNKFYLYYTNSNYSNGTDIFLATADDGIHFTLQNSGNPVFSPPVGNDRDVKFLSSIGTFFMTYGSIDTNKIFWTNSSDGITWLTHDGSRTIQTRKFCNFGPAILGYANGTADLQTLVYYAAGDTLDNSTAYGCINPTSWTIDVSSISISNANIVESFNSTGFKCSSLSGGFNCKLNYTNTLNESAIVVFFFVDSSGNIISTSVPVANQGISQIGGLMFCSQFNGTVKVSWRAYRQSDTALAYPLVWSRYDERQSISCIV